MKLLLFGANGGIGKSIQKLLQTNENEIVLLNGKDSLDITDDKDMKLFFDHLNLF